MHLLHVLSSSRQLLVTACPVVRRCLSNIPPALVRRLSVVVPPRRELLNQRLCLQHPHIVGLEEVFLTPYHLGIAMEYANGGDLSDYIADHVNRKVCQKSFWVTQRLVH